jgi:hypothetical protein
VQRFLREQLGRGPKPVTTMEEAASKAHIDSIALEQARADLGVVTSCINAGGVQAVQWSLPVKHIRNLSNAQLYALDLASRYKLQRSSMGWWAVASDGSALSDPVEILSPNTIRSLYRLGLLDGNSDPLPPVDRPSLWANEQARQLLAQIARDIMLFFTNAPLPAACRRCTGSHS